MGNKTCCPVENNQASFKINSTLVQVSITPHEVEKEFSEQETGLVYGKSSDEKAGGGKISEQKSTNEEQAHERASNKRDKYQYKSSEGNFSSQNGMVAATEIRLITNDKYQQNPSKYQMPKPEFEKNLSKVKCLNQEPVQQKYNINDAKKLNIPKLNPSVQKTFESTKFFILQDLKKQPLNWQKVPDGFFKYVKADGSLYIGDFQNGKAHGRGVYIFPDGSYYEGMFRNDKADSYGIFYSKDLVYKGMFKENLFEGKGVQQGSTYVFSGLFSKGSKYFGTLEWSEGKLKYEYNGSFNENNEFDGKGTLIEPTGKYEGNFKKGAKHGEGKYQFKNGYIYKGRYIKNSRQGQGKIINPLNKILFQGNFVDNLPQLEKDKGDKIQKMLNRYLAGDLPLSA